MMLAPMVLPLLVKGQFAPGSLKQATPTTHLVGASMFKNGFAVTQRTIDVPKAGATVVFPVPQGALGTLWFTPSEGTKLDAVVVENEATAGKAPAGSLDAILALNVGATVTLLISETEKPTRLICRIVSANAAIVVVTTTDGTTKAIGRNAVLGVEGKGLKSDVATAGSRRVMRLRTSGRPGRVYIVALERGLTWAPAYAVNLLPGGKELSLVAKATVVNDLERLRALDCRFVTGFPNLPFAEIVDPLVAISNAFALAQPLNAPGSGFGGGGFGGQQMGQFENRRGANVGFSAGDAALLGAGQAPNGDYREELFFYRQSGVSVDVGGRAAYTLFRTVTPYESIYAWDLVDPAPGDARFEPRILPPNAPSTEEVWQTLRFVNNVKVPLTTAPATTFSGDEIVGQDTLKYVSPGGTAELRVTRSLDLSPDVLEEETGRERGFVKRSDNSPIYDRVTVRGTLTLVNRKAKAVKVRIRRPFTGEWLSAEGEPTVTTTAAGLRQPNPTGLAEWTKTVEPGATLKLTYSLRLLVNS